MKWNGSVGVQKWGVSAETIWTAHKDCSDHPKEDLKKHVISHLVVSHYIYIYVLHTHNLFILPPEEGIYKWLNVYNSESCNLQNFPIFDVIHGAPNSTHPPTRSSLHASRNVDHRRSGGTNHVWGVEAAEVEGKPMKSQGFESLERFQITMTICKRESLEMRFGESLDTFAKMMGNYAVWEYFEIRVANQRVPKYVAETTSVREPPLACINPWGKEAANKRFARRIYHDQHRLLHKMQTCLNLKST